MRTNIKGQREEMVKMKEEGYTYARIALKFGVSRQRVDQIINNNRSYVRKPRPDFKCECPVCSKTFITNNSYRKYCDECSLHLKSFTGRDRTRELVRIRDKYTCQKCGIKWNENMRRFDVHHLNGVCGKKSRGFDSKENVKGLITYCHKCHMSLHSVRNKMSNGILRKEMTVEKKSKINMLYKLDFSLDEIARALNLSYATVFKYVNSFESKLAIIKHNKSK